MSTRIDSSQVLSVDKQKFLTLEDEIIGIKGDIEDLNSRNTDESNHSLTSDNASKLGGQEPSYYAKSSDMIDILTQLGVEELQTTAQDIKGAINEAFQSGVNVKNNVVTALSSKKVNVTTENTWSEITNAISNISQSLDTEITKLNIVGTTSTPYIKTITLENPVVDYKVLTAVREFALGSETTSLVCGFDNADSTSFEGTNEKVIFDGTMHLADLLELSDMIDLGEVGSGHLYSGSVDKSQFNSIEVFTFEDGNTPKMQIVGTNFPYVVKALNDINITGINEWQGIGFNSAATKGGKMLMAISVDSGKTYKYYNSSTSQWDIVNVNDLNDFASKGMEKSVVDTLTAKELELLRKDSLKLRFAYYLSVVDGSSTAYTDSISIKAIMGGSYKPANKNDYDVIMTNGNRDVDIKFYKSGTFTINFVSN